MANNVARSVIKSGWLWRRTSILHRWKRNWFVLWSSGRLMFYEDEHQTHAEDAMNIPLEGPHILTGDQLRGHLEPPHEKNATCLLGLKVKGPDEEKAWYLCADSADEACAWRIAFTEAAKITPQRYMRASNEQRSIYPYYAPESGAQTYYIPDYYGPGQHYYLPPGAQVVYIDRQPYYRDPDTGLMYALLLSSALFWPWMMFPFFWGCW